MALSEKNIFLFDGVGAIISFFSHAIVLPIFSNFIGLPVATHYILASFPVLYSIYSFICFFKVNANNPIWLRLIISANCFYCVVTVILLIQYWGNLKPLGIVYFSLEFVVIFIILFIENSVLTNLYKKLDGKR